LLTGLGLLVILCMDRTSVV